MSAPWSEQHASVLGGKLPRIPPGCLPCKWNTDILLIKTVYESSHCLLDIYVFFMHSALVYAGGYQCKSTWRHVQAGDEVTRYVLINAISFHQRWLLWHFMPPKRGDKTDRFRSCQFKGWYTAPLSRRGIDASPRACESNADLSFQDPWKITNVWKCLKNTPKDWFKCSTVTCKTDQDGAAGV